MNFLNPAFLFGLAAAAIPILIHLFTRRRPREVKFPSLEFLAEVNQSEIRRLKLRQWLLLLLRTLAIACIALAMSRPAVKGSLGPRSSAATTVVVLLDRSASTAAAGRGGALFDEARRTVEDLFTTLGSQDELLLVPYDRTPAPVTPSPSADVPRLRAAAQALGTSAAGTDHAKALELAAKALGESHALNRELFWVSDFQASGFGAARALTAPPGPWDRARVYLVPLAPRNRANAALTSATLAPSDGDPALEVGGAAFGTPAGDLALEAADRAGELGRGFLSLPERGEATALLPIARVPEEGGEVRLPADALELDNHRWFAAGRAGTIRVLLREDGGPSPLRLALEAGSPASGLAVTVTDGASLPSRIGECDVLVMNDVDRFGAAELQAVLDFWRAGGALFLVAGRHADPAAWNASLLAELGAGALGGLRETGGGGSWRLTRRVAGHAALAGFAQRPGEPLSAARFFVTRDFRPAAGARVLLDFGAALPALVEAPHAFVWTSPLDVEASEFVVSGAFLPLVHQCVRVLGRGTAAQSLVPGDRWSAPATTGEWRIAGPDGRDVVSALSVESGGTRLVSAPLAATGLYRVYEGATLRSTFAVNADPAESDLASLPEAALAARGSCRRRSPRRGSIACTKARRSGARLP